LAEGRRGGRILQNTMKRDFDRWVVTFAGLVFIAGLALRLRLAGITYLNPDEAEHALQSFGSGDGVLGNSLKLAHPPLLILITHAVSLISRSELALRAIPLLAGSLFPLVFAAWLRRVAGTMVGLAALFLLTLAPNLINLSAELRSYTLAFLFLSASLLVLEEALEHDRWQAMALYGFLLWLCILSDYSMAWFVGAAGLYALLRLRSASVRVRTVWAAGQLGALALYGLLYITQMSSISAIGVMQEGVPSWLYRAFPHPGEMLAFPFVNTLKQFAYLMASVPLSVPASVFFAIAVFRLWTGRTGIERSRARALAVLLVVPFALAIAGAYAHQFPYGRTRHTLVTGLFGAAGMAILLEKVPRRTATAILSCALLLVPLWHWIAERDVLGIGSDRNRKVMILQSLDYMRTMIPPGTRILSEYETLFVLAYYEGDNELPSHGAAESYSETLLGRRWPVASLDYEWATPGAYKAALAAFRRQYGIGENEPVWVLDGGWVAESEPADEKLPFTRAVRVFRAIGR